MRGGGIEIGQRGRSPGRIMAIGWFHDARGQPMIRPFQRLEAPARDRRVVQSVGPEGLDPRTIFVGETVS